MKAERVVFVVFQFEALTDLLQVTGVAYHIHTGVHVYKFDLERCHIQIENEFTPKVYAFLCFCSLKFRSYFIFLYIIQMFFALEKKKRINR